MKAIILLVVFFIIYSFLLGVSLQQKLKKAEEKSYSLKGYRLKCFESYPYPYNFGPKVAKLEPFCLIGVIYEDLRRKLRHYPRLLRSVDQDDLEKAWAILVVSRRKLYYINLWNSNSNVIDTEFNFETTKKALERLDPKRDVFPVKQNLFVRKAKIERSSVRLLDVSWKLPNYEIDCIKRANRAVGQHFRLNGLDCFCVLGFASTKDTMFALIVYKEVFFYLRVKFLVGPYVEEPEIFVLDEFPLDFYHYGSVLFAQEIFLLTLPEKRRAILAEIRPKR